MVSHSDDPRMSVQISAARSRRNCPISVFMAVVKHFLSADDIRFFAMALFSVRAFNLFSGMIAVQIIIFIVDIHGLHSPSVIHAILDGP